ncbi:hypothetical protein [Chryseobacterium glaciei]|nr:hypothetical protein [Chryseobacterium glaciei]
MSDPLNEDIDVGYYDPPNIILGSDPVMADFYRIFIKIKFKRKATPFAEPIWVRLSTAFVRSPQKDFRFYVSRGI